eukprot:8442748-Pyramimonas_sp.AAC.1
MWPPPLGPSVELLIGPRNAVLGVADACGNPRWGFRWRFLWGHEALRGAWRAHVATPGGALGGAPYGATKRCA